MADYSRQRAERDFNMNPPTNAPGQGVQGWDDMAMNPDVGTGVGSDMGSVFTGNTGNTNINDVLNQGAGMPGNGVPGNMNNGMGMGAGMPQQQRSFGEQLGEVAEGAFIAFMKGFWNFIKLFFTALTNNSSSDWNALGTQMVKISFGSAILGGILMFLGIFIDSIHNAYQLLALGSVGVAVGSVIVFLKPKGVKKNIDDAAEPAVNFDDGSDEAPSESPFLSNDEWSDEQPVGSEDAPEWDWGDDLSSSDFGGGSDFADSPDFDAKEAASKIDVPAGQYTRSYLVETFLKVLPTINPNFHKMESVYEESDEFMEFDGYLKDAARQTGINEDKLDELYLLSLEKNLFVIRLTCTRPSGIKEQEIADGVADCYKRDEYGAVMESREGVYASIDTSVGKFSIIIFMCNNVMVSLGDVFRYKRDYIEDSKHAMPLFWGVNEMGRVYCYDGVKAGNGSMLISGEGRSGKSWKGQSLIAQMSMFMSPKEVQFYFFDNKDSLSDYYYLSTKLPHVRGFCGNPLKYVEVLRGILEREKPIREKAIYEAGVNNINDYNKKNPTKKLPYIYIVVDEMAAAMKEMDTVDKELHKQFNSLMMSIVTNLPYFGIRLLLFPHRLIDSIIDKTTAQQISCRAVVGVLDFETLKTAVDVRTKKDFPYNLVKPGDMAIRTKDIRNGNATYTHSEVLSDSEQTNRNIFDYIGAVWEVLEPDCKPVVSYKKGNSKSGTTARDTSSDVGDYSVRGAFEEKRTPFMEDASEEFTVDDVLGSDDTDDFWSTFKDS